jgi:SAM-dependent methyltransferase
MYHWARKRTLRKKRKLVERSTNLERGRSLDVGSGTGAFVHEMLESGWEASGIEPDEKAREVAKKQYGIESNMPEELYKFPREHFDAISLWHVLEHVHDLHTYIQRLTQVLKKDGRIFIAVPNYTSLDASIYRQWWAAYDVPRHLYHFSPRAMEKLIIENGMIIEEYRPMWYDSFYISLLSSRYKNGKTRFLSACWIGFKSNLKAWGDVRRCSSIIYVIRKKK